MALSAQRYQITQVIGRFVIAIEGVIGLDMVNINAILSTAGLATNAASIVIALKRLASLAANVCAAITRVVGLSTFPKRMVLAFQMFRLCGELTFHRAILTAAQTDLMHVELMGLAAPRTRLCDKQIGATCVWLRLTCCKFRAALIRAKSTLTRGPSSERLLTVFAGACLLPLFRSCKRPTFAGTKPIRIGDLLGNGSSAMFASKSNSRYSQCHIAPRNKQEAPLLLADSCLGNQHIKSAGACKENIRRVHIRFPRQLNYIT